ncbi:MAG: DUF4126 domain-containing protein [Rhodospirillales bacterium]|nr:DUF4126 domain-containing protein [Rhodospirillales bacterium]
MPDGTSEILALASAVAWASGINLYAAVLALGAMHHLGIVTLPDSMQMVTSFPVMAAAGGMYLAQFVADKIPGVDLGWDAIHTFIRIPAGAFLAAATVGDADGALKLAAAIAGGALSLGTHATKASGRLFVNTHLPFVGTAAASVVEDIAVIGGLYAAVTNPVWFLGAVAVGIVVMGIALWLLAKFVGFVVAKIAGLFRKSPA